jgi:cation transport ATPase
MALTDIVCFPGFDRKDILRLTASLEQYSKHPLAGAILAAAGREQLSLESVDEIREKPGEGLQGVVNRRKIKITGRGAIGRSLELPSGGLPPQASGLECIVLVG